MVTDGPGGQGSAAAEQAWRGTADALAALRESITARAGALPAGWQGAAAEGARNGLTGLASWTGSAADGARRTADGLGAQAGLAAELRTRMPPPSEPGPPDVAPSGTALLADWADADIAATNGAHRAAELMQRYGEDSSVVAASFAGSPAPPVVTAAAGADAQVGSEALAAGTGSTPAQAGGAAVGGAVAGGATGHRRPDARRRLVRYLRRPAPRRPAPAPARVPALRPRPRAPARVPGPPMPGPRRLRPLPRLQHLCGGVGCAATARSGRVARPRHPVRAAPSRPAGGVTAPGPGRPVPWGAARARPVPSTGRRPAALDERTARPVRDRYRGRRRPSRADGGRRTAPGGSGASTPGGRPSAATDRRNRRRRRDHRGTGRRAPTGAGSGAGRESGAGSGPGPRAGGGSASGTDRTRDRGDGADGRRRHRHQHRQRAMRTAPCPAPGQTRARRPATDPGTASERGGPANRRGHRFRELGTGADSGAAPPGGGAGRAR